MKHFNPIHRQYVSPIDVQLLKSTSDSLEKGHQQAVKQASDLQVAIANLPLHESEAPYRQELLGKIQSAIEDGTKYGNSYGSLDDLIFLGGKLASDQGTLGRIESNKNYKEFIAKLDARKDITELDKEYFRELNPYEHKDKFDDDGNIIGSEVWKPKRNAVSNVDWNKHFQNALKYAAKDSGGGDNISWIGPDGKPTNSPNENSLFLNKSTGKYEKLTKDKLYSAFRASIEADPEAMISAEQDREVAIWDYTRKKAEGKISAKAEEITDPNGNILDLDSYIRKKANPFLYAASYYNSFSSRDITQWKTTKNDSSSSRSGNNNENNQAIVFDTNSNTSSINIAPTAIRKAVEESQRSKNSLFTFLSYNDIKFDNDKIDKLTKTQFIKELSKNLSNKDYGERNRIISSAISLFDEYSNNNDTANNLFIDPNQRKIYDTYSKALDSGVINPGSKLEKVFNNVHRKLFPTNKTNDNAVITFNSTSNNSYIDVKELLNSNLGKNLSNGYQLNGNKLIISNNEQGKRILTLVAHRLKNGDYFVRNSEGDSDGDGVLGSIGRSIRHYFSEPTSKDSNSSYLDTSLGALSAAMKGYEHNLRNLSLSNGKLIADGVTTGDNNAAGFVVRNMYKNGMISKTGYDASIAVNDKTFINSLNNLDASKVEVYGSSDPNGHLNKLDIESSRTLFDKLSTEAQNGNVKTAYGSVKINGIDIQGTFYTLVSGIPVDANIEGSENNKTKTVTESRILGKYFIPNNKYFNQEAIKHIENSDSYQKGNFIGMYNSNPNASYTISYVEDNSGNIKTKEIVHVNGGYAIKNFDGKFTHINDNEAQAILTGIYRMNNFNEISMNPNISENDRIKAYKQAEAISKELSKL